MKSRSTANPPNRFHDTIVTYDQGEGPPPAQVTLIEDQSRSILSHNDSPDLGFRWSVNPYRGCINACAYCLGGDTPILMGDGRTRAIADLRAGDEIYGTRLRGSLRHYVRTTVVDQWTTRKDAYQIVLSDGTELIASGDHRFLSNRGWKYVMPAARPAQRPFLTAQKLLGTGRFAQPPTDTPDYRRGYLCGMVRGDALLRRYDYTGRRRNVDVQYHFRLALVDLEALRRAKQYLADFEVETREYLFQEARVGYKEMRAIRSHSRSTFETVTDIIGYPDVKTDDWSKGFLAGIFDAEGSRSQHVLRISNSNPVLIEETVSAFERFDFDAVVEPARENGVRNIRLRGGLSEHLRFFHTTGPAISRKWNLEGTALKNESDRRVMSITHLGVRDLYDITTGTGDFIANGVVSHNCYARPSHEYLDLGAGTDFDTKITSQIASRNM